MADITLSIVQAEFPEDCNVIVGQSHFIKTAEDLYEAMVTSCPGIQFGIGFCEASGDRKIRSEGNNEELVDLAVKNAENIACGHSFFIVMRNAYPINVLDRVKNVQEVCHIFAATANPLQILVAQTAQGRGIVGVVDGFPPVGVENADDVKARRSLLSDVIGYKR
ncbi:MAG: adenosine-specific kinase [Pyramidobacter sp.]